MSGGALQTGATGAALVLGGALFARMGWHGLRGGTEAAAAAPARKLLFAFSLLFGAFVFVCGLLLALSLFVAE
jgi:hypothetical protein